MFGAEDVDGVGDCAEATGGDVCRLNRPLVGAVGGFKASTAAANCGSLRLRINVKCMKSVWLAKGSPAKRSKSGLKEESFV